jgi:SAM-dependent methyltransferase
MIPDKSISGTRSENRNVWDGPRITAATLSEARVEPSRAARYAFNFGSEYERERNQATLGCLSRASYGRAFEPGCSLGELTEQLARRCVQVMATDDAAERVARAEARCARFPNVEVRHAGLADGPPRGTFDLIVLSDFGGHFSPKPLLEIVLRMVGQLQLGGELVAAHSLWPSSRLLHGDTVHNLLGDQLPLAWTYSERREEFRVDVWQRI